MRKLWCLMLCLLLMVYFSIPSFAAEEVPADVLEQVDSVVRVLAEYRDGTATGSGFVIKSDKSEILVATNYHVVKDDPYSIFVWVSSNEKVSASILAHTDQKDLCILKLSSPIEVRSLPLSEKEAKQGEAVYAVGYPSAADDLSDDEAHASSDATITDGIVSALREATVSEYGTPIKILQINAALNSGNSGGPLFNKYGEVVGINTYGIADAQGIFGAIDVCELNSFLAANGIVLAKQGSGVDWLWPVVFAVAMLAILGGVMFVLRKRNIKKTSLQRQSAKINLREFMQMHPEGLGPEVAVALLLPVAFQLRDLHNDGKSHMEVSADTVMVSESGASLNVASNKEAARYTSGFAAPEVYRNQSAGNQTDIYSFCALLFYAASGSMPENALTRNELNTGEMPEGAFERLVQKGMALNAEDRFESMQNVILKMSPFNVKSFSAFRTQSTEENERPAQKKANQAKGIKTEGNEKKTHKAHKKVKVKMLVPICVGIVLVIIATYLGLYFRAGTLAEAGEFSQANRCLFIPTLTKLHDPKLCAYIDSGLNLDARKCETAKEGFMALGGYRNADEMAMEADYRYASQLADANCFEDAITVYIALSKNEYKDSNVKIWETYFRRASYQLYEEQNYELANSLFQQLSEMKYEGADAMLKETNYLWAMDFLEKGEYIDAYDKFSMINGYLDVDSIILELSELMYMKGILKLEEKEYEEAAAFFIRILDFKNSESLLLYAHEMYLSQYADDPRTQERAESYFMLRVCGWYEYKNSK